MKRRHEQLFLGIAAAFVVYLYVGGYLSQQREPSSYFATYDARPLDRCNDCYCADPILDYVREGFGFGYAGVTGYGYGYGRNTRYPGYGYKSEGFYGWRGYGYAFNLGNYGYGYGHSRFSRPHDAYGYDRGFLSGYGYARRYSLSGYDRNGYGYGRKRSSAFAYDRNGYTIYGVRRNIRELESILWNLDCNDRALVRKQRELVQMLKDQYGMSTGYGYSHSLGHRGDDHRTH
jgi:hypothetical protein